MCEYVRHASLNNDNGLYTLQPLQMVVMFKCITRWQLGDAPLVVLLYWSCITLQHPADQTSSFKLHHLHQDFHYINRRIITTVQTQYYQHPFLPSP